MLRVSATTVVAKSLDQIVKSILDIFILYALIGGPKTGYDIKKQIATIFGVRISYGTLYPHLYALEKLDWIKGTWVPHQKSETMQKKEYALTEFGRINLKASAEALSKLALTLQLEIAGISKEAIARAVESEPLREIRNILVRAGYEVETGARVKGRSGAEHSVEVFATRESRGGLEKLVIGIGVGEKEVGINEVLRTYTQVYDLDAQRSILLAIPRLNPEAKKLADFYHMLVYEGADLGEAIAKLDADQTRLL